MRVLIVLTTLALAGCTTPPPVVSDISDSAVKVESMEPPGSVVIWITANKACNLYGKTAVAMSYQCISDYCIRKRYLFACQ